MPDKDPSALARRKVEPMVRGLFPRAEQAAVLGMLESSVVFVTSNNIDRLLQDQVWDRSAWNLANLFLSSVGADLLGQDAPRLVGFSEETTCYVSAEYFENVHPFADFLVHEAAHIFHNCKRATIGLAQTRRHEWLIEIAFRRRETFAYSCEAYSRILERSPRAAERQQLAAEFGRTASIPDSGASSAEVANIVREAASARNGWIVIRRRCAAKGHSTSTGL
ncbi:MAG: hypothetical protein ACYDA0_15010 [Candidatus Dormibacteraceae bacterium]